ncbi:Fe2+-dependent dioxygenase [Rhodanobacter sp. L36]|uniref:Fe2+-dependent dioxygenase n=1 Tax=Rhodanobacter sp. L36 TaxID=1747221 RepID=UPI00131E8309|nr:Fe2+-dependent dioxygenase [Rhodanobacter sp. L36]
MFLRLPQVLNAAQLSSVRNALGSDQACWVDGRVTAGHQGAKVKRNQQLDQSSALARELADSLLGVIERNATFVSAVLPNHVYPPMFNRYDEGMHFAMHVDGSIRVLGRGQKLRTDLSVTVFLSPKDSYEGGELLVENDFGTERIKLDAGDMIIYSATARHQVTPVTNGVRLAAVFWVQSLVRGDYERQLLFELDQTIQHLTALETESESLVRLTAHYHGLLRLWSDT